MMEAENWLPCPGFAGSYEVSDLGNVRSLPRVVVTSRGPRRYRGRLLKLQSNPNGTTVGLSEAGESETRRVSRLVAETFMPDWKPELCVVHDDGDKENNRRTNLRLKPVEEACASAEYRGRQIADQRSIRGEEWREVEQFNEYQVSSLGRMKRKSWCVIWPHGGRQQHRPEQILRPRLVGNRPCFTISDKDRRRQLTLRKIMEDTWPEVDFGEVRAAILSESN